MKRFLSILVGVWLSLLCVGMIQTAEAACEKSYVYLLLDTSGSMKGTKHTQVRAAIKQLVTQFSSKLVFGLATFGSNYNQRVPISSLGAATINSTVDSYASNENYTRMGQAIYESGLYLSTLKLLEPQATRNRPYYLVLITDGYPTSDPKNAQTEAKNLWTISGIKTFVIGIQFNASLLNTIASEGQTGSAYNATNQSSITSAFNAIANTATAEVCDGLDNDCDGQVDENWPNKGKSCSSGVGACAGQGSYVCTPDKKNVVCTAKGGSAKAETCNNIDDDCDGQTDENLKRNCNTACGSGTETCSKGKWINCTATQPQKELCDGKDNDCDGKVDEDFPQKGRSCSAGQGLCQRSGVWQCSSNGQSVTCNAKAGSPQTEICDGKDNDCDGQVDEDWPNKDKACSAGSGSCAQQGKYVCTPNGNGTQCSAPGGNPSPEVCDGRDNDCNGTPDDNLVRTCQTACGSGIETCQAGQWVNCTARQPSKEQCNGQDDDCDGKVDEDLSRVCETKCGKGKEICVRARWDFCDAPKPEAEICDGKDNDCNGKVDDMLPKPCNGACGSGEAVCTNGQWSGCSGPQPEAEICDGKDNDCDGQIDNGVTRNCKTDCGGGIEVCSSGQWSACNAPLPQPEICNGKDDNCDGTPDENAICPEGLTCSEGQCVRGCRNGECQQGFKCVKGLCVGDTCSQVNCPQGQSCLGGRCIDLCTLVTCDSGLVCSNGQCVRDDCYFKGCPSGKRCVQGLCEDDPCKGVSCQSNEFCKEGKCIPSCAKVQCSDTETCVDGQCQADPTKSGPCSSIQCPKGQVCDNGSCVGDPCATLSCAKGRTCVNGQCVHDPCTNIQCPADQACINGQCVKKPDPPQPGENTTGPEPTDGPEPIVVLENIDPDGGTADRTGGNPNQSDDPGGQRRYPGCGCSTEQGGVPFVPVVLGLLLFAFVLRQRF